MRIIVAVAIIFFCLCEHAFAQFTQLEHNSLKGPPPQKIDIGALYALVLASKRLPSQYQARREKVNLHRRPLPLAPPALITVPRELSKVSPAVFKARPARFQGDVELMTFDGLTGKLGIQYFTVDELSEPTVAVRGQEIIVTYNSGAAISLNGGKTYNSIEPASMFADVAVGKSFCCDQIALYIRSVDLFVWVQQGEREEGEEKDKGNTLRLSFTRGSDLRAGLWYAYDFTPAQFGLKQEWFDFPDISASEKYLYVTINRFGTGGGDAKRGSLLFRLSLDEISASSPLSIGAIVLNHRPAPRLTQGAGSTMAWGQNHSVNQLTVGRWDDSDGAKAEERLLEVPAWNPPPSSDVRLPDNGSWLSRSDWRVLGAWITGEHIGFGWNVEGEVVGERRFPYVRVAVLDPKSLSVISEPSIFSEDFAIAYPAFAPNGAGQVGGTVVIGGPKQPLAHAMGTMKRIEQGFAWDFVVKKATELSTRAPLKAVWGDYFVVRASPTAPNEWVAVIAHSLGEKGEAEKVNLDVARFRVRQNLPPRLVPDLPPRLAPR